MAEPLSTTGLIDLSSLSQLGVMATPSIAGYAYTQGADNSGLTYLRDINVGSLTAGKILAGTIKVALGLGDKARIDLDGVNTRIDIFDTTPTLRVRIGNLGATYGIQIYNSAGTLMYDPQTGANNAGISDVSYAKLTAGNIVATGTITSGLLRTGSSGERAELDNGGINCYTGSGSAGLGVASGISVWRDGQSDTKPTSGFFGYWTATTVDTYVQSRRHANTGVDNHLYLSAVNQANTANLALISIECGAGETVGVINIGTTVGGMVYANGFQQGFANITGGSTSTTTVVYVITWPTSHSVPVCVIGPYTATNTRNFFVQTLNLSRSQCDLQCTNATAATTASINYQCVPIADA